MEFTAGMIAQMVGGKIEGNPNCLIRNVGKIESANSDEITFLSNPKYESYLYESNAGAVLIGEDFPLKKSVKATLIKVSDAYLAFTRLLEEYHKFLVFQKQGIEQPSFIAEGVELGEKIYLGAFSYVGKGSKLGNNVKIYPNVYIGDEVVIGDNTIIYSGVKVYSKTKMGKNCTLQSGSVIGSDGFGFAPQTDGTYKAIPQLGNVVLGDFVDVGANTVIDCATMGSTVIGKGVKLDNLIQIAHNVMIGDNTVIAAQTGISGSTKIGNNCVIAGQVGIVGHLQIAAKTKIGAQSGVSKTIETEGTAIQGSPAFEYRQNLKSQSIFRKLPELQKRIAELEEKIINLSAKSKNDQPS
ncbi:MAG: UDP-3-O-(3-hydroxymyristoyl)glucosamine N-acyltransferase [Cytophagales bacterium]